MASQGLAHKSKASSISNGTKSFDNTIKTAKISASTAIRVSRSQVLGAIIVSLFTLLGVALTNLDKLRRKNPPDIVNKLKLKNNVERATEYLQGNNQQARNVRRILMLKDNGQVLNTAVAHLDMFTAANNDRQDLFKRETERLNVGLESNNSEVIDTSRRRMNAILLEEGSNLQDSMIQMRQLIKPAAEFEYVPIKADPDRTVDRFMKRNPVVELSNLIPIKVEKSPEPFLKKNSVIGPDSQGDVSINPRRSFADLDVRSKGDGDEQIRAESPTSSRKKDLGASRGYPINLGEQNFFLFNRIMTLPTEAGKSHCIADKTCVQLSVRFSF